MSAEDKAKEFLKYVGKHYEKLRRNLAKNVTFDRELFENTFQDTVIRVHDAILRNDPEITDYEKYFFMASRKWYMTLSERKKRNMERKTILRQEIPDNDHIDGANFATIEEVSGVLEESFGEKSAGLFMDYFKEKSKGRMSYEKFGSRIGVPSWEVKDVVMKIKRHLRIKYPGGMTSEEAAAERARIMEKKIRAQFGDGIYRKKETDTEEKE